jgi:hypothetical protein
MHANDHLHEQLLLYSYNQSDQPFGKKARWVTIAPDALQGLPSLLRGAVHNADLQA